MNIPSTADPMATVMLATFRPFICKSGKGQQKGAVLIVGLILLMVITLLALAGIQGVSLQERMSGNAYDRNLAFQAAESALRYVENQLMKRDQDSALRSGERFKRIGESGVPTDDDFSKKDRDNPIWEKEVPDAYGIVGEGGADEKAKFTVIDLDDSGCFKVNAIGVGRSKHSVVVLQSVVCR
jgi:type IV pilus assembly protein PilX